MSSYTSSIVTATSGAGTGTADRLLFSEATLFTGHTDRCFRMLDSSGDSPTYRYAYCTAVLNDRECRVFWDGQAMPQGQATAQWEEEAFSTVRGWPRTVALHQQRLVFGGARDAGDAMWMSRAGQFTNFDLGDAKPAHAIAVNVSGTDIKTITHLVSARYLTIFSESAVYFCREAQSEPITPTNITIRRLAPFGAGNVRPGELDGGLLMTQAGSGVIRDIAYDEETVNVQAVPLSAPVETILGVVREAAMMTAGAQCPQQYGFFLNEAGSIWVLHSARTQRIAAWSEWTTKGKFLSVCVSGGRLFAVVGRGGSYYLEQFDEAVPFDSTIPMNITAGLPLPIACGHLSDGWFIHGVATTDTGPMDYLGRGTSVGGRVILTRQTAEIPDFGSGVGLVGVSFDWWIDPLPPVLDLPDGTLLTRVQRVATTRLLLRGAFSAQIGQRVLALTTDGMSIGEVPAPRENWWKVRHLGWARANDETKLTPRITRDAPLPVGVLAMTREVIL